MDKRISYYTLLASGKNWPKTIHERYSKQMSQYGVAFFDEDSEEERDFQQYVVNFGLKVERKTILSVTGKSIYRYPFHYLSTQSDREYEKNDFMDLSTACPGDEITYCQNGARQVEKVILDPERSKSLDIMHIPKWIRPRVHIISKRLKVLLESINATGCDYVPCLVKGNDFNEDERDFSKQDIQHNEQANFFQLVITAKTHAPCHAGRLIVVSRRCKSCGTVYEFRSDATPYFHRDELNDTDFQKYDEYITEEDERLVVPGEIEIMSAKVLRLLIENRLKGLSQYTSDPPIRYGVVEIRK